MSSTHRILWAAALLTAVAGMGCYQQAPQPAALPAQSQAAGNAAPSAPAADGSTTLSLSVAVEPEHGAPGQTVGPDYFHGGMDDRFRLVFKAGQEGFLYVINRGSTGNFDLLFPNRAAGLPNNLVKAGESLRIPPEGENSWMRFSNAPGVENISIFLSKTRVDVLEQLFSETPADSARVEGVLAKLTEDAALGGNLSSNATQSETVFSFTAPAASAYMKAPVVLHHD